VAEVRAAVERKKPVSGAFNPTRPKERKPYRWKSRAKGPSQHYELILDGAVRKYKDHREVCQDSAAGRVEYSRRLNVMIRRQNWICCLCPDSMNSYNATFEHRNPRGMAAARRDDRIEDENGNPMNGAAHWKCNGEKGSKRVAGA
jgi:hypothetical protein